MVGGFLLVVWVVCSLFGKCALVCLGQEEHQCSSGKQDDSGSDESVQNPQAAAIPPIATGAKAAMPRPMLKQNPAPVVRILVGLDQRGDLFLYAEQRPSIGFTGDRGVDDSVAGSRFEVPPFLLQRTGFGEGAGALDA